MWKTVLAGTTVLAIAGASLAYAQQGPGAQGGAQRWKPTAADVTAFGDARIASIHAGLKLSAEQEKNWPAVESALRDLAKQRSEAFAARASANRPTDPLERLSLRAKTMQERGAALEKLATAAKPLYQSLDDGQKHRLTVLARLNGRGFEQGRGHHGWRGHDGFRRGPGGQGGQGGEQQHAVSSRSRRRAGGLPDAGATVREAAGVARRLFRCAFRDMVAVRLDRQGGLC